MPQKASAAPVGGGLDKVHEQSRAQSTTQEQRERKKRRKEEKKGEEEREKRADDKRTQTHNTHTTLPSTITTFNIPEELIFLGPK